MELEAALQNAGVESCEAVRLCQEVAALSDKKSPESLWQALCEGSLHPALPFTAHLVLYEYVYGQDKSKEFTAPIWLPKEAQSSRTHLQAAMKESGVSTVVAYQQYITEQRGAFWEQTLTRLKVVLKKPFLQIMGSEHSVDQPEWLQGATLNIVDSCLRQSDEVAIVSASPAGPLTTMSYRELSALTNRVANGLKEAGFTPGDAIGIDMFMHAESVAIYLGIIKAGCVAVSIADSFAPDEIATRLQIANAKGIFTQDVIARGGKMLPLYDKVIQANAPKAIVIRYDSDSCLRDGDRWFDDFLSENPECESVACQPCEPCNILFSSGTTGTPKAIPWTHTTPLKPASDAYYHHDIHPGDVLAWPTNLGWMMGPWLIFAALINRASIALYGDVPVGENFGRFVEQAGVTMLGLVPTLVANWRNSGAMLGCDWSAIKCFSSTGECSSPEDMMYLSMLAGYKPILEYCGGTEIGGAYVTSTLCEPNIPSCFSTPTLGLDLVLLDEQGKESTQGEVALIPPSIGMSETLLNRDHHAAYYADMPKSAQGMILRRHGDELIRLENGYYRALGRVDDTMNLGGIKTSSAEIERCTMTVASVQEAAAISVAPKGGGPSLLVLYLVLTQAADVDTKALHQTIQREIATHLNPLFKVHECKVVDSLPRTASNKIMRRTLRESYESQRQ